MYEITKKISSKGKVKDKKCKFKYRVEVKICYKTNNNKNFEKGLKNDIRKCILEIIRFNNK